MSYSSPLFRFMEDFNPTIADATAQILRDFCKDLSQKDFSQMDPENTCASSKIIQDLLKTVPLNMNTNTNTNTNTNKSKEHEYMHRFDDRYEIHIDVPGVKKDNITMDVDEMFVKVVAERNLPHGGVKKYEQKYAISDIVNDVDIDKIAATHEDGVLYVRMPMKSKRPATMGRKINIV